MKWLMCIAILLAGCGGSNGSNVEASPEPRTVLEEARKDCGGHPEAAVIGDDGQSLFLDGDGDMDQGLDIDILICYVVALDVPDSTIRRIERTRAMDGPQEDSWDNLSASWTYHPDDGTDILIEME